MFFYENLLLETSISLATEEQYNGQGTVEYYKIVTSSITQLRLMVVLFLGMVLMVFYLIPHLIIIHVAGLLQALFGMVIMEI